MASWNYSREQRSTITRYLVAGALSVVMLTINVSGYCATTDSQRSEWHDILLAPVIPAQCIVIPEQRAVVHLVNVNMTRKGVTPAIVAQCRSPSR